MIINDPPFDTIYRLTNLSQEDVAKWWLDYLKEVKGHGSSLVDDDDIEIASKRYWDIRFKRIIEELSPNA